MTAPIREQLLASSDEFRKLADEHSNYSQRIETLANKKYLSEDEKIEQIKLKKLKLRPRMRWNRSRPGRLNKSPERKRAGRTTPRRAAAPRQRMTHRNRGGHPGA
jgi:uncharacterized protein YdcH (DUF465 family)